MMSDTALVIPGAGALRPGLRQLEELICVIERYMKGGARYRMIVVVPKEIQYCVRRREYLSRIMSRYSSVVRMLGVGDSDVGDVLFEPDDLDEQLVLSILRALQLSWRVCVANDSKGRVCRFRLSDGRAIPVDSIGRDGAQIDRAERIWKGYDVAGDLCLVVVGGGDVEEIAGELAEEFGFGDYDTLAVAPGKKGPSKNWKKKLAAKVAAEGKLCVANSQIGHAHLAGTDLRPRKSTRELREVIEAKLSMLSEKAMG